MGQAEHPASNILAFTSLHRPTSHFITYFRHTSNTAQCQETSRHPMGAHESSWKEIGSGGAGCYAESALSGSVRFQA
jgi:hypothetical protein